MKQNKITYPHEKIVNIYIVYELTGSNTDDNNPVIWLKMLILISTNIRVMVLGLIAEEIFYFKLVDLAEIW